MVCSVSCAMLSASELFLPDISIERVASLAAEDNLPVPVLNLNAIQPSTISSPYSPYRQGTIRSSVPSYPTEDPWNIPRYSGSTGAPSDVNAPRSATTMNGASSTLSGTGLPKDWWKKQETVTVIIEGQQGHLLNRYTVYEISTEVSTWHHLWGASTNRIIDPKRGPPVYRRYSEFAFLWDCLVRRYPFRLLSPLPPKRIQRQFSTSPFCHPFL